MPRKNGLRKKQNKSNLKFNKMIFKSSGIKTASLILIFMTVVSCSENSDHFTAGNLKCEYLLNPLGIDAKNPRFTWQMIDDRMGATQTGCQVFVGTDSSEVAEGKGNIWNSGRIKTQVPYLKYSGKSLDPCMKYFWSVVIWDKKMAHSPVSPAVSFETGMIENKNWQGSWISDSRDINLKPAPIFRKSFTVEKKIKSARAYIAVAGLYELYINGELSGNHRLDPAYTRFDRRTLYVVHDVTRMLNGGENVIGVLLGNGWYNHQSTAVWYFDKAPWRARPKFCLDLVITFDDGSKTTIRSGSDWKSSLSPVIFNSIYTGEHYDARLEQPGWKMAGFNDSPWSNSILVSAPSCRIVSQAMHPIRITEEIPAKTMKKVAGNTWLFDLGRNISGVSRLRVSGEAGTILRLKHAERLDKNGRADQSNIDVHYRPEGNSDPFQTDIYILSGKGEELFMPRFNYKGFQYVEVESNKPVTLTAESLSGLFMHSDLPKAGSIRSSDQLLDRIWSATNNSYLSNLFGYPTDCPQREKNGWTGDAHIASETGLYNFDGITVYEKWLNDHLDEQQPNGILPAIIPTSGWGYHWANGPDWTSTIAIIPWNIYLFYGDAELLQRCYDGIKCYVDHITSISPSGLTDWGLGDWIPVKSVTPKEFTSSVYYYIDVTILAKAAQLFDRKADYEKYRILASKIKDAINDKYLNLETGVYGEGLQTEQSVALQWGIVPEDIKDKTAFMLAEAVRKNNNHIDVGLLGTKAILNALSENGYADLAFTLASQESYPSWGWWILNGATTLYENWSINPESDISMNHIMFGEIGAWMYKALGGIFPDEKNPGFKNILLKPNFVAGLDRFEARHDGPFGTIISSWEKQDKEVKYTVTVPSGSSATLYINGKGISENNMDPGNNRYIKVIESKDGKYVLNLESGSYEFKVRTE
jgi:alpha-L-rhamnosidase